jgi:hypothetical protein
VRQRHVDLEAFPALTDLTVLHYHGHLLPPMPPLMTQQMKRLVANPFAIDTKSFAMDTSTPWNLREFALIHGDGFHEIVLFDLIIRVGTLCPHLVSLTVCGNVTWDCRRIWEIAHATPMLERVQCDYVDSDGHRLPAAANMWPRLESLTIVDTTAYVLRHLANPRLLRCLSAPRPHLSSDVYMLRAVIELAPPLTSFNIHRDWLSPTSVALVSAALAVIGATLETLTADVGFADFVNVGRYCPRLRRLYRSGCTREWNDMPVHLQRGCPLLEDYDV